MIAAILRALEATLALALAIAVTGLVFGGVL